MRTGPRFRVVEDPLPPNGASMTNTGEGPISIVHPAPIAFTADP